MVAILDKISEHEAKWSDSTLVCVDLSMNLSEESNTMEFPSHICYYGAKKGRNRLIKGRKRFIKRKKGL